MVRQQRDRPPRDLITSLAARLVPEAFLYPVLRRIQAWRLGRKRTASPHKGTLETDLRDFPLEQDARVRISWASRVREEEIGVVGPRIRLLVLGEEVLRLDCFGGKHGHWHINPNQVKLLGGRARLYYPQATREEHVERALFDLAHNAGAALRMSHVPGVRHFPLDEERIAGLVPILRSSLLDLIARHRGTAGDATAPGPG